MSGDCFSNYRASIRIRLKISTLYLLCVTLYHCCPYYHKVGIIICHIQSKSRFVLLKKSDRPPP